MKRAFSGRILIIFLAGLVSTSLFIWPKEANAEYELPQTDCDRLYDHLPVPRPHGSPGFFITDNMELEDGTKAFEYNGGDFVTYENNSVTFTFNVLFQPDGVASTVKLHGLDVSCNLVFGLGPIFHNLVQGQNVLVYRLDTNRVSMNGSTESIVRPQWSFRYLWIDVWDGHTPSNYATISYLVDINNIQNPTVVIEEPPADPEPENNPQGKIPVLIIPGIMGSELYEGEDLIWPSIDSIISSPSDNFLVESLALDQEGNSVRNIFVGEAIKKVLAVDTFESLIESIELDNYRPNDNFFLFPYDWRIDLNITINSLNTEIRRILDETQSNKLDIIAHSMGGLLVQNYADEFGSSNINKLFFVGTPHLGAPKAAYALFQGDIGIPFRLLNYEAIRDISRNSPSAYQLLPNRFYHEVASGYFSQNNHMLNYNESMSVLKSQGLNEGLIDRAGMFFEKDLYSKSIEGVEVYNILGCKQNTPGVFNILSTGEIFSMNYLNGDGTVPVISSAYAPSVTGHYYVKNGRHSELPSLDVVRELIVHLLNDREYTAEGISQHATFCDFVGKKLTWRSPVEVHIYDQYDNHAGPIEGGLENNIPGVSYDIIDGKKFIFLPTNEGQEYRVEGIGLEAGSFDLLITEVENEIEINTNLFNDIQIVQGSSVSFIVADDVDNEHLNFKFDDSNDLQILSSEFFDTEEEAFLVAMQDSMPEPEPTPVPPVSGGGGGGLPPSGIYPAINGKILGETEVRHPDGTLILNLSDGRTVYIIQDGKKYGFTSEEAFLSRGYKFADVIIDYVHMYELGGLIN